MKRHRDALLWGGILIPPLIWFLSQFASFAVAPLACSGQGKPALLAISIGSMLVTAAMAVIAGTGFRRLQNAPDTSGGVPARVRGMALAAFVFSVGFLLVELALSLPNFLLAGCE
jgi:hypothetical protein